MRVLQAAYGRVYKSAKEVIKDYEAGKDFIGDITTGFRLCSCRDFPNEMIELRYGKNNIHGVIYNATMASKS